MTDPGAGASGSLPIIRRELASPEAFQDAVWGRIFNARRDDRSPRAVVNASEPAHVVAAVRLAIDEACLVSVRSGGHSWAAWSARDDAVLIDLGDMRKVEYDEATGIVRCSPGITGKELNDHLRQFGKMFCGGHCPDVGLGGFLLQGGMGWNCKVSRQSRGRSCLSPEERQD
jgi:FAD/FMN-containing dehydrogenase